jgi:hypothetical protein
MNAIYKKQCPFRRTETGKGIEGPKNQRVKVLEDYLRERTPAKTQWPSNPMSG